VASSDGSDIRKLGIARENGETNGKKRKQSTGIIGFELQYE